LIAPFVAGYTLVSMRGMTSFYCSLIMGGVYFSQAIFFLVRLGRSIFSKNYRNVAWNLVGLLVSVGLFLVMFWVFGLHWAGTITNPPF
jgi:hypothetical protein